MTGTGPWRTVRRAALALLDGADLPAGYAEPTAGGCREVVTDPRWVAPLPTDDFRLDPELAGRIPVLRPWRDRVVRSCDPFDADVLRQALDWAAGAAARDEPVGGRPLTPEAVDALDAERARLRAWVADRSGAFWWLLGEHLGAETGRAATELTVAQRIVAAGLDVDWDEPRRARERLTETWKKVGAWVPAGFALAWWWLGSTAAWWVLAAGVVVMVVVSLWAARRYVRSVRRFEWQTWLAVDAYGHALEVEAHAAAELRRLSARYRELVDWAEIVGHLAHHPWRAGRPAAPPAPPALDPEAQPFALGLAVAEPTDAQVGVTAARVARRVMRQGWLQGAWHDALADTTRLLAAIEGRDPDDHQPDPDTELDGGARRFLLGQLRAGEPQRAAWGRVAAAADETVRATPVADLADRVQPLAPALAGPDPHGVAVGEWWAPVVVDGDDEPQPFDHTLWSAGAQVAGAGRVAHRHRDAQVRVTADGATWLVCRQVDRSRPVDVPDLALLTDRPSEPPTESSAPEPASAPEPVAEPAPEPGTDAPDSASRPEPARRPRVEPAEPSLFARP